MRELTPQQALVDTALATWFIAAVIMVAGLAALVISAAALG